MLLILLLKLIALVESAVVGLVWLVLLLTAVAITEIRVLLPTGLLHLLRLLILLLLAILLLLHLRRLLICRLIVGASTVGIVISVIVLTGTFIVMWFVYCQLSSIIITLSPFPFLRRVLSSMIVLVPILVNF